jgi:hypothetical protein
MKKTIKSLLVALLMGATSTLCLGQSDTTIQFKPKSNFEKVGQNDLFTGQYYTDKFGNQWKIYKTTQGNYYCHRQSRNGNWYKMYLEVAKGGNN